MSEQTRNQRRATAQSIGVAMCLAGFLVGCSDAKTQSSSGLLNQPGEAATLVELRDLSPQGAIERLRSIGFKGQVEIIDNGGCAPGNGLGKIYRHDPPLGAEVGVDESILLYSGCFDVVFVIEGKGRIEPVLDSPSERTDQPNRFNLKAYNSLDFTAVPEAGYVLDDVLINSEKMLVSAGSSFRIPEIVKDYAVEIRFVEIAADPEPSPPVTHTITSTVLFGTCTISPLGAIVVNEGANQQFTITPTAGVVQTLSVDGVPVACSQAGCTHTFTDVRSDHSLEVICS
jgi:hypothetical protein